MATRVFTKETKDKISASHRGKKHSLATRSKMSQSHTGKKHTAEARNKISQALSGTRPGPYSEARRKAISEGHKNHPMHANTISGIKKYKNGAGRKVSINGVVYRSMRAAAIALNMRYQDIYTICRQDKSRAAEFNVTVDWVETK